MRSVKQIVLLYPGETSPERICQPANYSLSRLLLRLAEGNSTPVYLFSQARKRDRYRNIEFIHLSLANLLKLLPRLRATPNTLIISQLHQYRHLARALRWLLPKSRLLVRLGGVYNGRSYFASEAFDRETRGRLAYLKRVDMVLSTADGTPVDLFMTKVGVPKARYRKWMNGFPKIENTRGCVRGDQVLCVARLSPEKGVDYVIDSFAKALPLLHRPHKLVIVGDGPDADRLRTQVRELELEGHVYFAGETFDVADHLYSSRLLVSGLANNTVMEAIATGTPVITVDLGEMRNLYGGYRNVFIVDYPPGGYGRIEPRHRDRVIADTSRMIVEVLNGRQAPARASETDGPALYSWDDRLSAELELYDSLFDS